MSVHVSNSLSQTSKFRPALLLAFKIFLISEIGKATSSPATDHTNGVIEVWKRFGNQHGISLTTAQFRAGSISRAQRDSCLENGSFCFLPILGISDECCGECSPIDGVLFNCVGDDGNCIQKDRKGCQEIDKKCCEDSDEVRTCEDNYCRRKCTKVGSNMPCEGDTDCCNYGDDLRGRCVAEGDAIYSTRYCKTCTAPDSECNEENDCCEVDRVKYACKQSGATKKCKKCIGIHQPCEATDTCCEDAYNEYTCQHGKCRPFCAKPGSTDAECDEKIGCCKSTDENENTFCPKNDPGPGQNAKRYCKICKRPDSECDPDKDVCCNEGIIHYCQENFLTQTHTCQGQS